MVSWDSRTEPEHPLGTGKAEQSPPCSSTALHAFLPQNIHDCHSPFITRAARLLPNSPHCHRNRGIWRFPAGCLRGSKEIMHSLQESCLQQAGSHPRQPPGGMLVLTLLYALRMADSRLFQASPAKPWMRTALQAGRVSSTAPRWASLREGCCEPKPWCLV